MARHRLRRFAGLTAVLAFAAGAGPTLGRTQGKVTVWDGVYSATQAERGGKTYKDQCASCHGEEMKGGPGSPGLAGIEFKFGWNGKTAGELFEYVKTMMPPGQSGSLSDQQYADLLAAIFKGNGFPDTTTAELPATRAALASVTIVGDRP